MARKIAIASQRLHNGSLIKNSGRSEPSKPKSVTRSTLRWNPSARRESNYARLQVGVLWVSMLTSWKWFCLRLQWKCLEEQWEQSWVADHSKKGDGPMGSAWVMSSFFVMFSAGLKPKVQQPMEVRLKPEDVSNQSWECVDCSLLSAMWNNAARHTSYSLSLSLSLDLYIYNLLCFIYIYIRVCVCECVLMYYLQIHIHTYYICIYIYTYTFYVDVNQKETRNPKLPRALRSSDA